MVAIPWSSQLRTLAERYGDHTAVTDGCRMMSYNALSAQAHALAARLERLGAGPGTPVATLLPNGLAAVWASYGVRLAGAIEVPVNWRYTSEEISWCAQLVNLNYVVTLPNSETRLRAIGLEPVAIEEMGEPDDPGETRPPARASSPGRILFTSGTTGRPKAAVYTQYGRWAGEQLLKATLPFQPSAGSRLLLMTPFSHGASLLTYAWCDYGGEVVLLDGVDTNRVLPLLYEGNLDAIFAPPTVLAKLVGAIKGDRIPGLRCIFTGTQPLPPTLYKHTREIFGPIVRITYGKTECVNPITVLGPEETERHFSSGSSGDGTCVGWASPGVELEIRPVADCPPEIDGDGQVWLRAQQMSAGMIGAAGFEPHGPNGWHATGDLGHIDAQGRLMLTGRMADVIKTGGYRVNPDEVEACLTGLDRCGRVCVTSVPSEYWGDVIIAIAEDTRRGWADEAAARVKGLSRHKQPRAYISIASLPRNAQGKVNRRDAARQVLTEFDLIDGPHPKLAPRNTDTTANKDGVRLDVDSH